MDLGGRWCAAVADDELRRRLPDDALDDSGWEQVELPGQWRLTPAFADSDGPLLYRRRFEAPTPAPGRRWWLVLEGVFYQSDVWLDGAYLGETEGYFAPHAFEVTSALAERGEHLLAVEVACQPQTDRRRKRNLTGVFQHWDCLAASWNPGGIWAPVRLVETGPVRLADLRVGCADASPERATLDLDVRLDAPGPTEATIRTRLTRSSPPGTGAGGGFESVRVDRLSSGENRVRWRSGVEGPELWWPHALGGQPLYDLQVSVEVAGEPSDTARRVTGLRQVRMNRFVTTVNGERLFLKGANLGPTGPALSAVRAETAAGDVTLARQAGLDLLRVHGHIGHPAVYEAADQAGMLLWQDLPLQWGYGNVRRQALRQAARAVDVLGHHPSIALWCAHNEPFALDLPPGGRVPPLEAARFVGGQLLPGWNKTFLDPSVRRTLERVDASRPAVSHSGVLPHPAWGTDSHLYYGWYVGEADQLPRRIARWPAIARFVSEFGAQAVPPSDDFVGSGRWPELDWERLAKDHALQRHVFDRRVPPAAYGTYEQWREATQEYQARLVRRYVETLRRLAYRPTGGFCVFLLADAAPAVSWSLLDHRREPKPAFAALSEACAAVTVMADWPAERYRPGDRLRLAVHAVSDLRRAVTGAEVRARVSWPGGQRRWRWGGDLPPDSCVRVGRIELTLPDDTLPGALRVELDLEAPGTPPVRTGYDSEVAVGPNPGRRRSLRKTHS